MAGDADDVAHIQELKKAKGSIANNVELYVDLEPRAVSLNMCESGLAMKPQRQNAAGSAYSNSIRIEARGIALGVSGHDLGGRRRLLEFMGIGIVAESFDIGELFLALEVLIERLEGQGAFRCASSGSIPMGFSDRQENACVKGL